MSWHVIWRSVNKSEDGRDNLKFKFRRPDNSSVFTFLSFNLHYIFNSCGQLVDDEFHLTSCKNIVILNSINFPSLTLLQNWNLHKLKNQYLLVIYKNPFASSITLNQQKRRRIVNALLRKKIAFDFTNFYSPKCYKRQSCAHSLFTGR